MQRLNFWREQILKRIQQNSIVDIIVEDECVCARIYNQEQEEVIEPFIYQSIQFDYDEHGYERINNSGSAQRIVRFSPSKTGEYRVDLYNKKHEILSSRFFISIVSNKQEKLVIKNGEGYFSNGTYFLPYGVNMAFPEAYLDSNGKEFGTRESVSFLGLKQYEKWIRLCAKNGINLIRIWCGSTYFSPDTEELGVLDYAQFSKLDKIFEMANRYKVRLKLTIEKFRYFVSDRNDRGACEGTHGNIFNKYVQHQGETISDKEWLKQEKYRKIWLAKLKEYKLRYSCNPALFAIEFWNEMNCYGYRDMYTINDWNGYMVERAREMFPNVVLLNSLGSLDSPWALDCYNSFCFEKFDWLQFHCYFDQGAYYKQLTQNPIEAIKKATTLLKEKSKKSEKKLFLAETGAVNDCHSGVFRYYLSDDKGMILVDTVYTPLFLGCLGPGNIWHWDNRYISAKNLHKYFKPLAQAIQNVDFKQEDFISLDLSTEQFYCFVLKGKKQYIGFIRNKGHNWQNELRDNKKILKTSGQIDFSNIGANRLATIKIWEEERGSFVLKDNRLCISESKYGMLIKGNL